MRELQPVTVEHIMMEQQSRLKWTENDTPELIASMIFEERDELEAAIQEAYLGASIWEVASEVGDIKLLHEKYKYLGGEERQDVTDCIEYAEWICDVTGLNENDCVEMKLRRNAQKYPSYYFSNGLDYNVARSYCKDQWNLSGGDKDFSHRDEPV